MGGWSDLAESSAVSNNTRKARFAPLCVWWSSSTGTSSTRPRLPAILLVRVCIRGALVRFMVVFRGCLSFFGYIHFVVLFLYRRGKRKAFSPFREKCASQVCRQRELSAQAAMVRVFIQRRKAKKPVAAAATSRYKVESLLSTRLDPVNHQRQVLVKWQGYPASACTWEPYQNLVEDGFDAELRDLVERLCAQRYLFVVRLENTKCRSSNLYASLRSVLKRYSSASLPTVHMPGNVHFMLEIKKDKLQEFVRSFRWWLDAMSPVTCRHAQLFKISDSDEQLSVYPPVGVSTACA